LKLKESIEAKGDASIASANKNKKPGASSAPGTPTHSDNYQLPKFRKIVKRRGSEVRGIEGGFDTVVKEVSTLHPVSLDRERSAGFIAYCFTAR